MFSEDIQKKNTDREIEGNVLKRLQLITKRKHMSLLLAHKKIMFIQKAQIYLKVDTIVKK